jgi:hypothetical protein
MVSVEIGDEGRILGEGVFPFLLGTQGYAGHVRPGGLELLADGHELIIGGGCSDLLIVEQLLVVVENILDVHVKWNRINPSRNSFSSLSS